MRQTLRVAAISALGLSLSGCIAAAAVVPLVAGGGMAASRIDGKDATVEVTEVTIPRPPFDSAPGAMPTPAATTTAEPVASLAADTDSLESPSSVDTAFVSPSEIIAGTNTGTREAVEIEPSGRDSAELAATAPTATPAAGTAPAGAPPPVQLTLPNGETIALSGNDAAAAPLTSASTVETVSAASTGSATGAYLIDTRAYDDLFGFALSASARPKIGKKRQSALLVAPGALKPDMIECGVSQPAVLIDVDPGEEVLDLGSSFAPNPALAQVLAALRSRNVSVHWLSGNSAADAGTLRRVLADTGLDPEGQDELVLMRYRDDRKQVRRRAVGSTHCLIAIAGEERRDFDELYRYLRDPGSAAALETLVGDGWFIVPPALATTESQ